MLFLLWACTPLDSNPLPTSDILDHRQDPGPAPSSGFQLRTPEYMIEPHSEQMLCFFGRYEGEDVGATYYEWFQDPEIGHHFMTLAIEPETQVEDGMVVDCTDPSLSLMTMPPLLQGTELIEAPNGRMVLPEGVAIELKGGQRWALQSHYVNPTDEWVLVQDAINVVTVPHDEIEMWASTYVANSSQFSLPSGRQAIDISCIWPESVHFLNMMGHMHENGRNIYIQHGHNGEKDLLYSVEGWDPSLIYGPIMEGFPDGQPLIEAGDTIEVRCEYDNLSGEVLEFPDEMCAAAGIAWPMTHPYQCDNPVIGSSW